MPEAIHVFLWDTKYFINNLSLIFSSLLNSLVEVARIFKLHLKMVKFSLKCDVPLENSTEISSFNLIKEKLRDPHF